MLAADVEWETWLAEAGDRVLGHVTVGRCRDDGAQPGEEELYALYVDPGASRRGVGRLLHRQALERLGERGATSVYLWVFEGNRIGRAFFAAQGWKQEPQRGALTLGGDSLAIVRYVRPVPAPK